MLPEEIILKPVVTEKSAADQAEGKYTFKINKKATKIDVKNAVETLFNVKVTNVSTMNYKPEVKSSYFRKGKSVKPGYKKAIVTIDLDPQASEFKEKGGKTRKALKKYETEIEGFLGA